MPAGRARYRLGVGLSGGALGDVRPQARSVRRPAMVQARTSANRACPSTLPLAAYSVSRRGMSSSQVGRPQRERGRKAPLGVASPTEGNRRPTIAIGGRASAPSSAMRSGPEGSTLAKLGTAERPRAAGNGAVCREAVLRRPKEDSREPSQVSNLARHGERTQQRRGAARQVRCPSEGLSEHGRRLALVQTFALTEPRQSSGEPGLRIGVRGSGHGTNSTNSAR